MLALTIIILAVIVGGAVWVNRHHIFPPEIKQEKPRPVHQLVAKGNVTDPCQICRKPRCPNKNRIRPGHGSI